MRLRNFILVTAFITANAAAQEALKLSGTVIGSTPSVDYGSGQASNAVNTREMAFDGDLSTYFASYDRSLTWCGLDLGTRHVITRVGWSPRDDGLGEGRVVLAVFEGANEADFSDAVPLYMNDAAGTIGQFQYADVDVSRGFRYVRYVGPNDARCNVAEVEFYGYEGQGSDDCFYRPTNLPLVAVHIADNAEPQDKVTDLACTVTLIPADENDTIKTKAATIRLRGNASMGFPKKPYRIKFDKKHHVFGSPASAKKWTLINNYGDKTLMRNILAFEASRRFEMEYTPFCVPVDVMVNGEYKGCYQLCDQVEAGAGRIEVEEMDASCTSGEELTGGYHIEADAYAYEEECYFYSSRGTPVTVKYPDSDDITCEQSDYIRGQFNAMEAAAYASDFTGDTGYRAYLDITSFLRHFLVGEFSGNTDTYWSTHMYKHRGDERFYVGPVWDFDIAFENDNRTYPVNSHSDYVYTYGSSAGDMKSLVDRIIKSDGRTLGELREMWADARRNKGMDADSFLEYVDETADLLDASQRLNFIRWPILSSMVHQNWQAAGSYEGEVEIVKNFVRERFDWLDEKLSYSAAGIDNLTASPAAESENIYTLDGRCAGNDATALRKGVYVRQGKKFVVR